MPIVIVPGAFTRASSFDRLARRLDADVVTPTRGRIAQFDVGGLRRMQKRVDAAIRTAPRDGTPLVIIGHSMGGLLTYRACRRSVVDAQVLLMPVPPGGLAADVLGLAIRSPIAAGKLATLALTSVPARRGWFAPPAGLFTADASPDTLEASRRHRTDESPAALIELLVGSRDPVHRAHIPTLVVGGTQDGLVPPGRVQEFAAQLAADHLEMDVAHNFSEEPSGLAVEDAVVDWLHQNDLMYPR